jgi:hypothetical protein
VSDRGSPVGRSSIRIRRFVVALRLVAVAEAVAALG